MARRRKSSQIPRNRLSVSNIGTQHSSSTDDAGYKDNLLGGAIKFFDTLYSFARFDLKGGGSFAALFSKDALRFADGCHSFRIVRLNLLDIPCDPVITAPGHD